MVSELGERATTAFNKRDFTSRNERSKHSNDYSSSFGGQKIRLHFSNRYGEKPVQLSHITFALQSQGASLKNQSLHTVTFNHGQNSITVVPGAEVISDSINQPVKRSENVTVSVYVKNPTGGLTWHQDASQTTFFAPGIHTKDMGKKAYQKSTNSWFLLSEMEVLNHQPNKGVVIAFGDSITDGYLSQANANHRWPDFLANQLASRHWVVLNEGISGNRILQDTQRFGLSALARLNADVLNKSHVKSVIFLEGVNDIGNGNYDPKTIINGIKQIAVRLHAHNIRLFVGTILPYKGAFYDTPQGQKTRLAVNKWIRHNHDIDGFIDFDKAMRSTQDPLKIKAKYDHGDHLHPNDKGYAYMAKLITDTVF